MRQAEGNMIYTVTLNPSLDYVVTVDNFRTGITNRTSSEQIYPGGKGLNVSTVLKNLGIESTAFGFIAGFTGEKSGKWSAAPESRRNSLLWSRACPGSISS